MIHNYVEARRVLENASEKHTLFASSNRGIIHDVTKQLFQPAWEEVLPDVHFTANKMRHTTATNAKRMLTELETKVVTQGMEHTLGMARKVYCHYERENSRSFL